jgi:hypothetical protein
MAVNNTVAIPVTLVRMLDTGMFNLNGKPLLPAAAAADNITLLTFPNAGRIIERAPQGARQLGRWRRAQDAEEQRRHSHRSDGCVTTAATAGVVTSATIGPVDFLTGDTIELLVAGGTVTPQIVEFDLTCQRA